MNYYKLFFIIIFSVYCNNLIDLITEKLVFLYLKTFTKGNFLFIDNNNIEIFNLINDNKSNIPVIKVYNKKNFIYNIYKKGELGIGESYVNKDWNSSDKVDFLCSLSKNYDKAENSLFLNKIYSKSTDFDKKNILHHYDVGNDFYMNFLQDDFSAYSCGFWFNDNDNLNISQYNKVNTIIKKLKLIPGQAVLDLGCGWGKIANYISIKTKTNVTGITISDEQIKYAVNNYNNSNLVFLNKDYRNINEKYDRIYSIGMFEHVRYENYDIFFETIKKSLKPKGRFVLHTIISFTERNKISISNNDFVLTHIFPGGQIPLHDWIVQKALNNGLRIIHFEGFGGQHYAKTLNAWNKYLHKNKEYILLNYSEELFLKYDYYFSSCEAFFTNGILGIGHYIIVSDNKLSVNNSFNY